jgi:hypothetical protein
MSDTELSGNVDLAGGESATLHLHRTLAIVGDAFPDVFAGTDIGESDAAFKRAYPEVLPRFEAARADAGARIDIAAALVEAGRAAVVWNDGRADHPLDAHVEDSAEPFPLTSTQLPGSTRLRPVVPFDGVDLSGSALTTAVHELVTRGSASPAVAESIDWIVDRAGDDGIDLRDRRIVMLGAGAELAPTRMWLEGGADVLWIDVVDPPPELTGSDELSGSLHWVEGGADLLTDPARIRATVESFATDDPVDLGLYAYAAGRAREWRLAAAMNAIVDALPVESVRGVAMLVSPTTCGVLGRPELDGEARRRRDRPRWQAVLDRVGGFGRGTGHVRNGETCINRGIVSIQGGSYQAAQYLGKLMAAEVWATRTDAIHVSANTAGVTMTESLSHPVFDTAFSGAGALGIETFDPQTTARLNGLLTLRDRLDPAALTIRPAVPDDLFVARVHGGIYELPYPIEPALRVATGIGLAKDPRRVAALLRRS